MVLPADFKTFEEIPEGLREHYVEREGVWVLDGYTPKKKLDEFRSNNRNLSTRIKEVEDELLKFKGIDPEKYKESVTKLQELEDERLAKAGEFGVLKSKLEQSKLDLEKKHKEEMDLIRSELNGERIRNYAANTVMKLAVPEEGNMKYILSDLLDVTRIDPETGQYYIADETGKGKRSNGEGADLTLEDYLQKEYIPKSKLFRKSEGSGALGSPGMPILTNQVRLDQVSGKDISSDTLEKLAKGEITVVD